MLWLELGSNYKKFIEHLTHPKVKRPTGIRVLELSTSYAGTSSFILKKARSLNQFHYRNEILAPKEPGESHQQVIDGVKVHRFKFFLPERYQTLIGGAGIPENFKSQFLARLQAPLLIAMFFFHTLRVGRSYHILHANWSFAGIAGICAASLLNKPFVLTMHGAEVFKLGYHPVINFLLQRTKNMVVNSTYTLKALKTNYNIKQIRSVKVIPFGVELNHSQQSFTDKYFFEDKIGIAADSKVIFSLGRLVERKGHIYLMQAFHQLIKKYPDLHLIIGGSGPEKSRLDDYIAAHQLSNVHFIDFIPDEELPYFYTNAQLFVLPAIIDSEGDTEGLGVVNIEAMYYGTPVISTDVGGISDVVKPGKTGLLVPQRDSNALAASIETLLNDEQLYQRLVTTGKQYVIKQFNWENLAHRYINFYTQCLHFQSKSIYAK